MSSQFAVVRSRAVVGLQAPSVDVETHIANGLPLFVVVGLAETEVKEARERVRSAIQNAGLEFPHNKRIIVNLAPADLPKDSGRFDLPIALGILAASGQIDAAKLAQYEFAGELSLAGELRSVRGALAMGLTIQASDVKRSLVLPADSAQEAALVPETRVYFAKHLLDVVRQFLPGQPDIEPSAGWGVAHATSAANAQLPLLDLAEVKGQAAAKRALEIAAAGNHSLLMMGSPGSGKTMLAQRFAGLLPEMTTAEALESAVVLSLGGRFTMPHWGVRPTSSPHHTASAVALVGGGSPPRPGEISLAHQGVLFLDELPEFPRSALEALREPLENGSITISRAAHRSEFPARFVLIAAMNPCPCGYLGSQLKACRCTPEQVSRYQGKLSGPLLDRIDLHIEVPALPPEALLNTPPGESTQAIRERVVAARAHAMQRQGKPNQALQGADIDTHCALAAEALVFLKNAASKLGWSARTTHRVLKLARTIADLAQADTIQTPHVAEAIQYRRALRQH